MESHNPLYSLILYTYKCEFINIKIDNKPLKKTRFGEFYKYKISVN